MKCTFASNEWEDKRQWRTHTERHFHVHKYNNILNSWIGKTNRKRENCYLVNTHELIVNNSKQMWILRKKYAHTHLNWQAHEYKRKYTIKRHNWLQVFPIFLCSKHFRLYPTYLLHLHLIHCVWCIQRLHYMTNGCDVSCLWFYLIVHEPGGSEITAEKKPLRWLFVPSFLPVFHVVSHLALTLQAAWAICCSIVDNCYCLYVVVLV